MSHDTIKGDPTSSAGKPGTTRRTFLQASAITGLALMGDLKTAFANCTFLDSNGLPVYWNGLWVITDNSHDPNVSTFSKTTPPAVVARDSNHLDVFTIGNDSNVWTDTWTMDGQNSSWGGWNQVPGGPFSNLTPVAAVSRDASHLDIFVIGNDSKIWTNEWAGSSWVGFSQIAGGPFSNKTPVAVVSRDSSHMDIFVIGNDSKVWTNSWSGSWGGWVQIAGGPFSNETPVAVVSRDSNHMDIFVIGNDSKVWTNSWSGSWGGWAQIVGGPFSNATPVAAVSRDSSHIDIFVIGNDSKVWTNSWAGSSWSGFSQVTGGPFSNLTPPVAVKRSSTEMNVFVIGNDSRIWMNAWDSGTWCGWGLVTDNPNVSTWGAVSNATPPAVVSRDSSHLDVLAMGTDSRVYRNTWGPGIAVYIPLTTTRICQLTGNYDPAGLPHINNTVNWGFPGTDMGCPVEFSGKLYFLYGDVPTFQGDTNPNDADPICYTTDASVGSNGITLGCVLQSSGVFRPFTVTGYGTLGTVETPTGAFVYNGILYAFIIRGFNTPYSSLTGTTDPSTNFTDYYDISQSTGKFFQIAPLVIQNSAFPGLPSSTGDGLLMLGASNYACYLAWMPLQSGVNPPTGIQYYAGNGIWSTSEADAVPVITTQGTTQISLSWLSGPQQLIAIYTRASVPYQHESVVARVATSPWDWSDEIPLFHPDRDAAWGQFMHLPGNDNLYLDAPGAPSTTAGYAYSAFLLNRYTSWNPTTKVAIIYWTMDTFVPYQVQLMKSQIQFG